MKQRPWSRLGGWTSCVGVLAGFTLLQFGGCTLGVADLQAAALGGAIFSASNSIFTATQTVFFNLFGL